MNTKDSSAAGGSRAIRLYSPRECADLLNVSRATLSRLLSRGTLPSVILSGARRDPENRTGFFEGESVELAKEVDHVATSFKAEAMVSLTGFTHGE